MNCVTINFDFTVSHGIIAQSIEQTVGSKSVVGHIVMATHAPNDANNFSETIVVPVEETSHWEPYCKTEPQQNAGGIDEHHASYDEYIRLLHGQLVRSNIVSGRGHDLTVGKAADQPDNRALVLVEAIAGPYQDLSLAHSSFNSKSEGDSLEVHEAPEIAGMARMKVVRLLINLPPGGRVFIRKSRTLKDRTIQVTTVMEHKANGSFNPPFITTVNLDPDGRIISRIENR